MDNLKLKLLKESGLFRAALHAEPNSQGTGGLVFPAMGPSLAMVATEDLAVLFAASPDLLILAIDAHLEKPEGTPMPETLQNLCRYFAERTGAH